MNIKIDYALLGQAVQDYMDRDYRYVEVPWMIQEAPIRATLPEWADPLVLGLRGGGDDGKLFYFGASSYLLGSAEQAFLTLGLPAGAYIGVSPCFRNEPKLDVFYQVGFMKAELFVIEAPGEDLLEGVINDALEVMSSLTDEEIVAISTEEGTDLTIGGVEIGSYGRRSHPDFGPWVYGTGLALPRFSVADALSAIV